MKFGQRLVQLLTNISKPLLALLRSLETSFTPFYDFHETVKLFLKILVHNFKIIKNQKLVIIGFSLVGLDG